MDYGYYEAMDHEFNAQFDDVRERFAATAQDADFAAYQDYCAECEEEGVEPKPFEQLRYGVRHTSWPQTAPDPDEIPF